MEALQPALIARPTARCLPSAATLAACLPKIHMSHEEKERIQSIQHQSFRRLQENHIRCAQILHGTMQWRAVEFMDANEESVCLNQQEVLRRDIKALESANAKLVAAHKAAIAASADRRSKRPREPETSPSKRLKMLTSL
ncbi:hypothetical protein DYB30_010595 [Aphanomyces astaci]|uniref:Uncharacterized protein n=1 Tax=Aphanomyces astaci TaxID=112090 RepID=A0A397CGM0_APHAT|nr:hypothetical protein DYB30_010595 [Aphanomyces astaci]